MDQIISVTIKLFMMSVVKHLLRPVLLLIRISSWRQYQKTFHPNRWIPAEQSLIAKIPQNSWDSHMHVIDPKKYPLAEGALYTPETHLLSEAMKFETTVGISNMVLVQPSIYKNDNSCMLEALRSLGPYHGRAVVAFDPDTISIHTLDEWHKIGVRGVRVNFQSMGQEVDEDSLAATLQRYADIIRPYDWVLQLYVPLATVVALEKIVPNLRVKVCLDHFGSPSLPHPFKNSEYSLRRDPYLLPGFKSLTNLLSQGRTYVKLSAPYRISKEPELVDLEPVTRELLRVAGVNRTVFASDWPHTRFEGLNIRPYIERLIDWCGDDEALIERVFKSNAESLWVA